MRDVLSAVLAPDKQVAIALSKDQLSVCHAYGSIQYAKDCYIFWVLRKVDDIWAVSNSWLDIGLTSG